MANKKKKYDLIIVGAGPAGMFAALEILEKSPDTNLAIIERGDRVENRGKKETMIGFGGGGTYSDGKLHYSPILSHRKAFHLVEVSKYIDLVEYVDDILIEFGVDGEYYPNDEDKVKEMVERSQRHDIKLYIRRERHVGTDKLKDIVKDIQDDLEEKGAEIITNTKIEDVVVKKGKCKGVVSGKNKKYYADKVLIAPGRIGAIWLQKVCEKHDIEFVFDRIEVGVRVEFPNAIMKEFSDVMYESIFEMRTDHFDDIARTFCPCPNGKVAVEDYKGYVCVNGHTTSKHDSVNANFAFLTEIGLSEPFENTTLYAKSIAELATTLGGGKPILQRLADLRSGRRSTWRRIRKSYVTPTLMDVTPGDISMGLPYRVVTNLLNGLEKLDKVMKGVNAGSTLLYAPEVKYRGSRIKTKKNLETKVEGLFVAGDGAGVSGNIIGAAVTGVMAARGMIED